MAAESATLQTYLQEIAKFPRLAIEQEHELGRRIRQHQDNSALNALVESNLRFVVSYAKRYRNLGVPVLELIHEGNLGLIEAARRFDPDSHIEFTAAATWWVRQSIMHLLSERSHQTSHAITDQRAMSDEDAQTMGVPGDELPAHDRMWLHAAGVGVELAETLHDHAMREIDDDVTRTALVQELEAALAVLEPKERHVMRLRYGLHDDEPWTVQQIGEKLRLSRAGVRQLESTAMQKLRRRRFLRSFLN